MTKKLIEVALPLPEINDASAYDKMPGIGAHSKGIHHWWARLRLAGEPGGAVRLAGGRAVELPEKFPTEQLSLV